MSDRQQRTIDFLDDQLRQADAQYATLRAQLAALVAEWQTRARQLHARARDAPRSEGQVYDFAAEQTWDAATAEVAALLREPPEADVARCPEHGIELLCPTCFGVTLVATR
jgi:hypothetical protein